MSWLTEENHRALTVRAALLAGAFLIALAVLGGCGARIAAECDVPAASTLCGSKSTSLPPAPIPAASSPNSMPVEKSPASASPQPPATVGSK